MRALRAKLGLVVAVAVVAAVAAGAAAGTRAKVQRPLLCPIGSLFRDTREASLSPNGGALAEFRSLSSVVPDPLPSSLWVADLASGRTRFRRDTTPLNIQFADPLWSPDGGRIAMFAPSVVAILRADGSGTPELFRGFGQLEAEGWSPDGRSILVASTLAGQTATTQHQLLLHLADGSITDLGRGEQGAISPDGRQVAIIDDNELLIEDIATRATKDLGFADVRDAGAYYIQFSGIVWSPAGDSVAYVTHPGFSAIGYLNITTVDGASNRTVGDGTFNTASPPGLIWTSAGIIGAKGGDLPGVDSGLAVLDPVSGDTRLLATTSNTTFPIGFDVGRNRVAYAIFTNVIQSQHTRMGFRSVSVDGSGDRPLLPCKPNGYDSVLGTSLNDVIDVVNGKPDAVRCLGGNDTVTADRKDTIFGDCEHVIRR